MSPLLSIHWFVFFSLRHVDGSVCGVGSEEETSGVGHLSNPFPAWPVTASYLGISATLGKGAYALSPSFGLAPCRRINRQVIARLF